MVATWHNTPLPGFFLEQFLPCHTVLNFLNVQKLLSFEASDKGPKMWEVGWLVAILTWNLRHKNVRRRWYHQYGFHVRFLYKARKKVAASPLTVFVLVSYWKQEHSYSVIMEPTMESFRWYVMPRKVPLQRRILYLRSDYRVLVSRSMRRMWRRHRMCWQAISDRDLTDDLIFI